MKNEIVCGIYCIENTQSGKKYVGQSIDVYRRWKNHIDDLNRGNHCNTHLQRSWNLYGGENFQFYIIEECLSEELNEKEIFYINLYDTCSNGYNQTLGGGGNIGYKHSDDVKIKMSSAQSERFKDIKNREKMRDAHKYDSRPIYQIDFDGNVVAQWPSTNWAGKMLNLNIKSLYNTLNHLTRRKTYNGYIWIYVDEYNLDTFDVGWYVNRQWNYKSYYQYDLNFNLIKKWDSIIDAEKAGFKRESIYRCCKLHIPTYKGFIFRDYLIKSNEEEGDSFGCSTECGEKSAS